MSRPSGRIQRAAAPRGNEDQPCRAGDLVSPAMSPGPGFTARNISGAKLSTDALHRCGVVGQFEPKARRFVNTSAFVDPYSSRCPSQRTVRNPAVTRLNQCGNHERIGPGSPNREPKAPWAHSTRRQISVACQSGASASSVSVLPEKRYRRTWFWPIQFGNHAPSMAWMTIPASASTVNVPQYPT